MENKLQHHGITGMKWGIRRFQNKDGTRTPAGKKRYADDDQETNDKKLLKEKPAKKKSVKDLTDEELREKISRLELEKRYADLSKGDAPQKSKGQSFVLDVLEKSGKNIASQLVTYAFGTAVNKAFKDVFNDPSIVNPKKGQKDK